MVDLSLRERESAGKPGKLPLLTTTINFKIKYDTSRTFTL